MAEGWTDHSSTRSQPEAPNEVKLAAGLSFMRARQIPLPEKLVAASRSSASPIQRENRHVTASDSPATSLADIAAQLLPHSPARSVDLII